MWFIFGLMLGSTLSGGPSGSGAALLGSIPLRCMMAIEESDEAYAVCRRGSMVAELNAATTYVAGQRGNCSWMWGGRLNMLDHKAIMGPRDCDIDWHIALEAKALRRLNELAKDQGRK